MPMTHTKQIDIIFIFFSQDEPNTFGLSRPVSINTNQTLKKKLDREGHEMTLIAINQFLHLNSGTKSS